MRRVIAVAIISALGIGTMAAVPAWASGTAEGGQRAAVAAAATPTKLVVYRGLELSVPATWPVYRLDLHPATCVRYDIHAVYLGTPGTDQQCPAHLVGRTQTVSIIPAAVGPGGRISYQRAQPGMIGGAQVGTLPSVHAALVQDTTQHVFRVTVSATAAPATVVATYGASAVTAEQVMATLRTVAASPRPAGEPSAAAASSPSAPASKVAGAAGAAAARGRPKPQPTTTLWRGVPPGWPVQIIARPPLPPPPPIVRPRNGFDTCTAPLLKIMKAWRRGFSVVGIYIGGVNMACSYGNLSAGWIRLASKMGWRMLPTYVGAQSACWWQGDGVLINPKRAAAEGVASANDAIADARVFGLGKGTPIYYDMEAYDQFNRPCVTAVLRFISGWSSRLIERGYVPAVYSSTESGIADMNAAARHRIHIAGFTAPTAIWIAQWDGLKTLRDATLIWPLFERAKQWLGLHYRTIGGYTLNIDSDLVGGPTARSG